MLGLCMGFAIMFTQVMPQHSTENNLEHEIIVRSQKKTSVCRVSGPLIMNPPQKPKVPLQNMEMYRLESTLARVGSGGS